MAILVTNEYYEQCLENSSSLCFVCGSEVEGVHPQARMEECPYCDRHSVFGIQSLVDEGFAVLALDVHDFSLFDKRIKETKKRLRSMSPRDVARRNKLLEEILQAGRPAPNKVDVLVEELRRLWSCEEKK